MESSLFLLGALLLLGVVVSIRGDASSVRITSVSPRHGSLNGATRLTLIGSGFSKDQFNFGDGRSNLGNRVKLVSETRTYDCDPHKDGNTQFQITCDTRAMVADDYYVRVSVDGENVPPENHCNSLYSYHCRFTPHNSYTPTITSLEQTSGVPGDVRQINGKIMTSRYGSNRAESTNGRTQKILRVYAGAQMCELRNDDGVDLPDVDDELYGIQLDNGGTSNNGYMKCKMAGTYVGNSNFSYILQEFGRSDPSASTFRVTAQDKITMFQSYAVVYNITPSTGSEEGGTRLTISGRYFDETDAPAKVVIGDTVCKVVSVQDATILCDTEPKPADFDSSDSDERYAGNRGVMWNTWNESSIQGDFSQVSAMEDDGDASSHLDQMFWDEGLSGSNAWSNYMFRLKGYFIPPRDGEYKFTISRSDDDSTLFFSQSGNASDLAEIATTGSSTTKISEKFTLTGGMAYPLAHVVREKVGSANGQISVRMSNTGLPGGRVSSSVLSEKQAIFTKSTVVDEKQTILLNGWTSQTKRAEVQRVEVKSDNMAYVSFRLGLGGVWTAPLDGTDTASTVKNELNSLPSVSPDSVSVSQSSISGGSRFVVTFNTVLGDVDMLEAVLDASTNRANATLTVTETTKGKASMAKFALQFMNANTAPLSKTASASDVETAVKELFSVRCPAFLSSPPTRKAFELDYEDSVYYWERGTRVSDQEPFCGTTSLKNPAWLYREHTGSSTKKRNPNINLMSTGKVCFAYKGKLQQKIYVAHNYQTQSMSDTGYRGDTFSTSFPEAEEWNYVCVDLKALLMAKHTTLRSSTLARIYIYRVTGTDLFIDNILIVTDEPTTDIEGVAQYRRLRPPAWIAEDVTVTGDSSSGYDINIKLRGCAFNLPLFSALGAQVQSSEGNQNATYDSNTWKNGATIDVWRVNAATPPVDGTFSLTIGSNTVFDIPANVEAADLKQLLQAVPGVGEVDVVRTGKCSAYTWVVTWNTAPGDQPTMGFNGTELTGNVVLSGVVTSQDGGVNFDPIPGDLLRTMHDTPQVNVDINKIPSRCVGSCGFVWDAAATPTVTSATPNSGSNSAGTTLTIAGTDFSTNNNENGVTIGGAPCVVSSSTATEIQCAVGRGPAGPHNIIVNVGPKGLAKMTNGALQFSYGFDISSIEPTEGGTAGGTLLMINGTGFSSNITAMVGGSACPLVSAEYSSLTCITPSGSAGAVAVAVTDSSNTANSGTQFTYSTSLTPTVTAVDTTTVSIASGQTLTITGTGFGASAGASTVTLNGQTAAILSYGDTEIQVTLPVLAPGAYPLKVNVDGKGYADTTTNSISDITYDLSVTNVFPTSGSLEGGTRVTLTGTGFPTEKTGLVVNIGGKSCDVITVTATQIVCTAPSAGDLINVDNKGVHPTYGENYAWSRPTVEALVGDTVKWTWTAPEFTSVAYSIQETLSATNVSAPTDGFSSGAKTGRGAFQYQFTTAGTYTYWSGFVNSAETISMRGVVTVTERSASSEVVEVKVLGKSAIYNTGSGVPDPSNSLSCAPTTSAIGGCSESAPSNAGSGFNFAYLKCKTPTVTSMSPTQGTATDTITITGTGFSTTNCQNQVTIGSKTCTVATATATQIECTIDAGSDAEVGILSRLAVTLSNLGSALNTEKSDVKRHFVLLPHISSISPSAGSTKGGTRVTVTGGGFYGTVTVTIGSVRCKITSLSYNSIECTTANAYVTSETLSVKVRSNGQDVEANCTGSCAFEFSSSQTPTVTSVSPTAISTNDTELTIVGTGFGSDSNAVNVSLGGAPCDISDITATTITCLAEEPIVGTHAVDVYIDGKGSADASSVTVTVNAIISSVFPTAGSVRGGNLLSISGLGFKKDATTVKVGNKDCSGVSVNAIEVQCIAPEGTAGTVQIQVLSNEVTYPQSNYDYNPSETPDVTSLSTSTGSSGESVTISGTGFSTNVNEMSVTIDAVACAVTTSTANSIACTLGIHSAGRYPVIVTHSLKGIAQGSQDFTYGLTVSSVSPTQGSYGGGQTLTLAGVGFDSSNTTVTVCNLPCAVTGITTATQVTCTTPAKAVGGATQACDVVVSVANLQQTQAGGFTYSQALTPTITDVNPRRGGTGGGTSVTITGTGFGSVQNQVSVDLGGETCTLVSVIDTQVVCTSAPRRPSIQIKVKLSVGANGIATQDAADFEYIDVWSSQFTWNYSMPVEGDFVVIPSDMTVLLDTNTPVLKMILIDGGKLIFDEKDVELQAENILITNGGTLQVGTEAAPFQHKGIITLHGHPRSQELPIYGTKTIAVREGTLDLHGKPPGVVWTVLGSTVNAGQSQITLAKPVTWQVGEYIAIGSTGDKSSQAQNEMKQITAVSGDGLTLTLDSALDYQHLGETMDLGSGHSLEARAPVGLLTRNVLVRGSNNLQWADKIAACPDGFNAGEFAVQTCFQGRFGEEIGTDQYGAQIMIHAERPNEQLAKGRIENIEMTYAGQAFRLGRYAIHFHLNGDMDGNYVRGCAIHHSFNRAVNIHGTHYVMIQNNVIYDIMGGAVFLEDGIEIGNTFDSNLAIFVKGSSSLQNDDITPAAFWLTNPNNTVTNNMAAGGTHFGFWYRMHHHPDGPSYDPNYCPQHIPLGIFRNNTVLSHGWFGIWIFQEYYPMEGGGCNDNNPIAAKYESLIAWNNEKGAEWVGAGAIQFHEFFMVNNLLAGIEMKLLSHSIAYSETRGAMLKDCVIVAKPATQGNMVRSTTKTGIITPYARGLLIKDMTFVNFDSAGSSVFGVTKVDGKTENNNGGFTYKLSGLSFLNSPNKIAWRWMHEAVYHDLDGTLTGIVGGKAVPTSGILPNDKCTHNVAGMSVNAHVPGSICQADVEFNRWSFNQAVPESLVSKNVSFVNQFGSTYSEYKSKRVTHKQGWMVLLPSNYDYKMEFVNAGHITNISYTGKVYDLKPDTYVILSHNLTQRPDRFKITDRVSKDGASSMVTFASSNSGDYYFNPDTTMVSYFLSGKGGSRRRKRGLSAPETGYSDQDIHFRVYRCFFNDCLPPVDPNTIPPPENRPADFVYWSNISAWKNTEAGFGGNYGDGTYGPPLDGDDVKIPTGVWMVADVPLPVMGKLYIQGVLEMEYLPINKGKVPDFTLNCTHIFVNGGRLIAGWEKDRYTGNGQIVLRGNHLTPDMPLPNGPNMGAKVLGVFGGLDLHGIERSVTWTKLSETAPSGSQTLSLVDPVDWTVGEDIVVAPTGYSAWETEIMKITGVSNGNRTLALNGTLKHKHLVTTTPVGGGKTVTTAAEVGLLSRNIKIIGGTYDKLLKQAFGARVLVGKYNYEGQDYSGYARVSNVEFYHTGQEGWTDEYDPRFSIAFLDTGASTELRPSYLRNSAFHHGFAPAIGTFGVERLNITNNVIYHTVGSSIQDSGIDNAFRDNLVTLMVFSGTFNQRDEGRTFWDAGIDVRRATRPVLTGNAVAGSERAGYRVNGEPCDGSTESWQDNTAHSTLVGVEMLPNDGLPGCSQLSNFTVYKAWDIGMFFEVKSSVKVVGFTSADNTLGMFPMVLGPNAVSHQFENKFVEVRESLFIGTTADFDCTNDVMTDADRNVFWSSNSRSWRSSSGGKVGMAVGTFSIGSNKAPEKPWTKLMAYNSIGGLTRIIGSTFVNFQSHCSGKKDVILTTNPKNDDAQHPVRIQGISLLNVDDDNKVYFHRPRLGTINPSDCVDMDCDGLKKIFIDDLDGSFIGQVGTIIPESEWEWGGDARRGLGDYRIPKTLLTDTSGNRIPVSDIATHKGVIRDSTCVYQSTYQAYECSGLDYELLMLESMDSDTETRRLSPVAIVGDGYIDLVNGPQDHGWCMGYTCQKRLSTFPIVVASGKYFILHYTGTSPQNSRLRLLNSDESQAFVVGIFYSIPQRLDVYVNDEYIPPTNAVNNADGQQVLTAPTTAGEFMPAVASDPTGSNYFDKSQNTLHVLVRGPTAVNIVTSPLIVIGFDLPAMTVDDFYGANLIFNLATFLGIPASKIKVAKAVSEVRNRRKRDAVFRVELEISNPPSNQTNSTSSDPDAMSYDVLQNMTSAIINGVQLGTLSSVLNVTILGFAITEPVPSPDSSAWKTVVATSTSGQSYNFAVQIPQTLVVETEPVGLSEGNVLTNHPVLKVLDTNGDIVTQLGSKTNPWQVTASLLMVNGSSPYAMLTGNTTVDFILGYANFTNLIVDYSGTYKLNFVISYPDEAAAVFTAQSAEFFLTERSVAVSIVSQNNETVVGQNFTVTAELIDAITAVKVENIAWKNHTWTCTASLYQPDLYQGQLSGTTQVPFDPSTGMATLNDLRISAQGHYFLQLRAVSNPPKYDITAVSEYVVVRPVGWVQFNIDATKNVKIRFNVDYNSTLTGKQQYLEAAIQNEVYSKFSSGNFSVGSITFTEGSILATIPLEGTTAGVDAALDGVYQAVRAGTFSISFFSQQLTADSVMWVDNQLFYQADAAPGSSGISTGVLVAIIVCCVVLLIAFIGALVFIKMKIDSKKKIAAEPELNRHERLLDDNRTDANQPQPSVNPYNTSRDPSVDYASQQNARRPVDYMSVVNDGQPTNGPSPALARRQSEGIQEIPLDASTASKPVPLSEQVFDEDEEGGQNGQDGGSTDRSGMKSNRSTKSRPPSKPSVVWDDGESGFNKRKTDPFAAPSPYGQKLKSPLRKGAIAGKLPSIVDHMNAMTKKKKRMRKRHSTITIDTEAMNADQSMSNVDDDRSTVADDRSMAPDDRSSHGHVSFSEDPGTSLV